MRLHPEVPSAGMPGGVEIEASAAKPGGNNLLAINLSNADLPRGSERPADVVKELTLGLTQSCLALRAHALSRIEREFQTTAFDA